MLVSLDPTITGTDVQDWADASMYYMFTEEERSDMTGRQFGILNQVMARWMSLSPFDIMLTEPEEGTAETFDLWVGLRSMDEDALSDSTTDITFTVPLEKVIRAWASDMGDSPSERAPLAALLRKLADVVDRGLPYAG